MRKSITIFFIVIFISAFTEAYAQNYWVQQPAPSTKLLRKCFFTDSLYGWAIGDSGTIVHTTNSGVNWNLQQSGTFGSELKDIFFLNRNDGWIIYIDSLYRSIILKTTNSGGSWSPSTIPDSTIYFGTIFFTDISTGYISGFSGKIYKTTTGGANWFSCGYDTAGCFYLFPKSDIYFVDSQTGYTCGGVIDLQGIIMKTTNAGLNWNSLCMSPEPLNEIKYYGGNNVYVMGGDYDLGSMYIRSTNSGVNWVYDTTGCFGNATGFAFRTSREVWAALSFVRQFAVNLDSMRPGSRWQKIDAPDDTEIYDLEFMSPTKGWAVGAFGRIYKYNTDLIGITPGSGNVPSGFQLNQNYPNPFNPATVIKYSLPNAENVSLVLYDIQGREIRTYTEGVKQAGSHSIEINAGELASGVYFYTLTAGNFIQSRKMVLIK
jgi:photosystem II stability/assembly factor-like uncharacterized protein